MQRKDVIEVTRYVLVAADVLRGAQRQCEANDPDGEGEFTMDALCAPSAVAKALASLVGGSLSPTGRHKTKRFLLTLIE